MPSASPHPVDRVGEDRAGQTDGHDTEVAGMMFANCPTDSSAPTMPPPLIGEDEADEQHERRRTA